MRRDRSANAGFEGEGRSEARATSRSWKRENEFAPGASKREHIPLSPGFGPRRPVSDRTVR